MTLLHGTTHKLPADFGKAIASNKKIAELWQEITPLRRELSVSKKASQRCQVACAVPAVGLGVHIDRKTICALRARDCVIHNNFLAVARKFSRPGLVRFVY